MVLSAVPLGWRYEPDSAVVEFMVPSGSAINEFRLGWSKGIMR